MSKIVFTQAGCEIADLQPFSLTRKVQDFRIGGLTIREKWERSLGIPSFDLPGESSLPEDTTVLLTEPPTPDDYLIACHLLPDKELVSLVKKMKPGDVLTTGDNRLLISRAAAVKKGKKMRGNTIVYKGRPQLLDYFFSLLPYQPQAIGFDVALLRGRRRSVPIDKTNGISNAGDIFLEKGARVKHAFLNAEEGPVYIAKNALVMEGASIRGPVFIGENAVVKMGAKIYGATTIGPGCTVGGEIKNSLFFGYSNKAHDGYIGDAVVGEWCNFGAGTSCSNMKNNFGDIRFSGVDPVLTRGLKKCGVIMGDYSRTAINTSINTGTVVGVSAHVFGNGFTPKYIPDFSWGFDSIKKYELEKALRDAGAWKGLKGQELSDAEKEILTQLYNKR